MPEVGHGQFLASQSRAQTTWTLLSILLVILLGIAIRQAPLENPAGMIQEWPSPGRELILLKRFVGISSAPYVVAGSIAGLVLFAASYLAGRLGAWMRMASMIVMTAVWTPGILINLLIGAGLVVLSTIVGWSEKSSLKAAYSHEHTPGLLARFSTRLLVGVFIISWFVAVVLLGAHFESKGYSAWWEVGSGRAPMIDLSVMFFLYPIFLIAVVKEWRAAKAS